MLAFPLHNGWLLNTFQYNLEKKKWTSWKKQEESIKNKEKGIITEEKKRKEIMNSSPAALYL